MSIEDPVSALQALDASDERQRSPVTGLTKDFLRVWKLLTPPGIAVSISALEWAADWLSKQRAENRNQLVNVMADELKYRGEQIERLITTSEEHRQFMEDRMPGLLLDTLQKAENVRAKERITRMARILTRAAEFGPTKGADYFEELERIATNLTEVDVAVLREIVEAFAWMLGEWGRMRRTVVLQKWPVAKLKALKLTDGDVLSSCYKLESYGLIERMEDRSKNNLSNEPSPFGLLSKGKDFTDYIRTQAPTSEGAA
jgi:hypothetical protein